MLKQLTIRIALLLLSTAGPAFAQNPAGTATGYSNDFAATPVGSEPDGEDFMVLSGRFSVRETGSHRFLELAGAPLDTFVAVFGPDFHPDKANRQEVAARIQGSASGRRYAAFAVGICGVGGYRLQVTPSKQRLELYQGEKVVASQPYDWKPATWTECRLSMVRQGEHWRIQGRVWTAGQPEPSDWSIRFTDDEEPISGKASIWGIPYSGKPIQFDDLSYRIGPG